jgi:hypothetical protein
MAKLGRITKASDPWVYRCEGLGVTVRIEHFYLGDLRMAGKKKSNKKTTKKSAKAKKTPDGGQEEKELYTLAETARVLEMTEDQVGKIVADRKLEPVTQGEQLMFGRKQVDDAAANLADFLGASKESPDEQQTMTEGDIADMDGADGEDESLEDSLVLENAPNTGSGLLDLDLSGLESLVEEGRESAVSGKIADVLASESGAPVADSIDHEAEAALKTISLDSRESSQEINLDPKTGADARPQYPAGSQPMPAIPEYEGVVLLSNFNLYLGVALIFAGGIMFLAQLFKVGFSEALGSLKYAAAGGGLCFMAVMLTLARDVAINIWHLRANSRNRSD